jgi:hypothetical protein
MVLGAATIRAVALVAVAAATFVWLRSYAPLASDSYQFPQPARQARPLPPDTEQDSRPYVVSPGLVTLGAGLYNDGRWPVEVDGLGLAPTQRGMFVVARIAIRRNPRLLPLRALPTQGWKVRIKRSSFEEWFTVTFRARCAGQPPGTFSAPITHLRVHYRYLGSFARSEDVQLGAPMMLAC